MEFTRDKIVQLIQDIVYEVCGVKIHSEKDNLLDRKFDINPADFLYIFDILEKELQLPVYDVLKDTQYTVMEVGNLGDAFIALKK